MTVTEERIIEKLRSLDPSDWADVDEYITYLKYRSRHKARRDHTQVMTGQDWLESGLIGLWADRKDIGDSLEFAHKLRREAEQRGESS